MAVLALAVKRRTPPYFLTGGRMLSSAAEGRKLPFHTAVGLTRVLVLNASTPATPSASGAAAELAKALGARVGAGNHRIDGCRRRRLSRFDD